MTKEVVNLVTEKLDKGVNPEELIMLEDLVTSAILMKILPESDFAAFHLARFDYLMGVLGEETID